MPQVVIVLSMLVALTVEAILRRLVVAAVAAASISQPEAGAVNVVSPVLQGMYTGFNTF